MTIRNKTENTIESRIAIETAGDSRGEIPVLRLFQFIQSQFVSTILLMSITLMSLFDMIRSGQSTLTLVLKEQSLTLSDVRFDGLSRECRKMDLHIWRHNG